MTSLTPGLYQHFKGGKYLVLGTAKHSETLEDMVVYVCLYENELSKIWVRPASMFLGTTLVDGQETQRFTKLETPEDLREQTITALFE